MHQSFSSKIPASTSREVPSPESVEDILLRHSQRGMWELRAQQRAAKLPLQASSKPHTSS